MRRMTRQNNLSLDPQFPCNTRNYCDKTESIGPFNKGKTAHENLNQLTKKQKKKDTSLLCKIILNTGQRFKRDKMGTCRYHTGINNQ